MSRLVSPPRQPQALFWTNDDAQAILCPASEVVATKGQKPDDARIAVEHKASTGISDHAHEHDVEATVIGIGDERGFSQLSFDFGAMDLANRAPFTFVIAH
ncbi:MAG: hypothetical protein MUC82_16675 [Cypionkella sp.]|jgi:hypothetical protein|nr:hypothetical protein [Cypionkella sp.]